VEPAKKVFISDCEGPITKNDNAAELSDAFIPKGERFFSKISLYDDYLAEIMRRTNYKPGDTLRLILPFFKAFGLDNRSMVKFSRRNIQMIPQADDMLREISESLPSYIISTSYSQYIVAVCEVLGFPFQNTYSTAVNLDDYSITEGEKKILKDLHARILSLPDFVIPKGAVSLADFTREGQQTIAELDEIFWSILPEMKIYRLIDEVCPIGGREKAAAVRKIVELEETELHHVFYVGDSITDIDAFRMVRDAGGFALSFNGNDWAVQEASFAVTAQTALPIGWLASAFANHGIEGLRDLTMNRITPENRESITELSCKVRKTVRTEKIGSLG
jgi:predicted HAD superfamily phosphohydrolase